MYYDLETDDYPLSEHDIRALWPDASFPSPFVPPGRWVVPAQTAQPAYDAETHNIAEMPPVRSGDTVTQAWQVIPMTAEQLADRQSATVAQYEQALDDHLDSVARVHRFSDRTRLALRAAYPNDWQSLGVAYGTWMDICNKQAQTLLQSVLAGQVQIPTLEAFIASFPAFEP